jgi:hypothetical protein
MRWDFYMVKNQTWITLGPTCVPEKLAHIVEQTEAGRVVDFYKDYANSSLLWNKMRSLQAIYAAQQYLKHKGIRSIQTYMDYELFDTQWHAPDYVRELQTLIEPQMHTWDGKNFLDWCRDARHEVTVIGLHPLAAAHRHAAEFWQDRYARSFAD